MVSRTAVADKGERVQASKVRGSRASSSPGIPPAPHELVTLFPGSNGQAASAQECAADAVLGNCPQSVGDATDRPVSRAQDSFLGPVQGQQVGGVEVTPSWRENCG